MLGLCCCMLTMFVAASGGRLTYLNLAVDTALISFPVPWNMRILGGQYGPRVFFGSAVIVGQPSLKRTGDVSANSVGNSEFLDVRAGIHPLVLQISDLFIDGYKMSATLTVPQNSVHLAIYLPETPDCGVVVTTLTVESLAGVSFNSSNPLYNGQDSVAQDYIQQYVLPQVNGYLTVWRQTIQQYIYNFCLNIHTYKAAMNPYLLS